MALNKDKDTDNINDGGKNKNNFYCYILQNDYEPHKNRTYNGYTVNPKRRIRQHNQEIKGGAKYTKSFGNKSWRYMVIVTGFCDSKNALQCEWRIKKPNNKKRSKKFTGPEGRIRGLKKVLGLNRWTGNSVIDNCEQKLTVWILKEYAGILVDLPENVSVIPVDIIDPSNLTTDNYVLNDRLDESNDSNENNIE